MPLLLPCLDVAPFHNPAASLSIAIIFAERDNAGFIAASVKA